MTTVDIVFRYRTTPGDAVLVALASMRDVYGVRRLSFDRQAQTLQVEYDATRLNAAAIAKLVRESGLDGEQVIPLIVPAVTEPALIATA